MRNIIPFVQEEHIGRPKDHFLAENWTDCLTLDKVHIRGTRGRGQEKKREDRGDLHVLCTDSVEHSSEPRIALKGYRCERDKRCRGAFPILIAIAPDRLVVAD